MCGIIGAIITQPTALERDAALHALRFRGPDASAQVTVQHGDTQLWLGHARLSIIDVSSHANQPFQKHHLTLIYNGELYNYQQLRAELQGLGVIFQTQSDTEVILEAWARWGVAALPKLRGMFAFAIYNAQSGTVHIARDGHGIKPLYYYQQDGLLAFGSEARALKTLLGKPLPINTDAMMASLFHGWLPDAMCMYEGMYKLLPGHVMQVALGAGEEPVITSFDVPSDTSINPTVSDLKGALAESVEKHLIADVPVGVFLSGGLDSSLIAAMASKYVKDLHAFTIDFGAQELEQEGEAHSDLYWAEKVAAQYGITLHRFKMDPSQLDIIDIIQRTMDEPIGDSATLNLYLMCQSAQQMGIKVLLSGMGADEYFGGYRKHQADLVAQYYQKIPTFLRRAISSVVKRLPVAVGGHGLRAVRLAKKFLSFADLPASERALYAGAAFTPEQLCALAPAYAEAGLQAIHAVYDPLYQAYANTDRINHLCAVDAHYYLPGNNLAYTDRATMAASVEVRVPFVDNKIFALAMRVPGAHKTNLRETKIILKKAAEGLLPDDLIYRRKTSFAAPIRTWLRGALQPMLYDYLAEGRLVKNYGFSWPVIEQMIRHNTEGKEENAQRLWQVLTLELWLRREENQNLNF